MFLSRKLQLASPLSPEAAIARLKAATRPPAWPNPSLQLKARYVPRFVGEVHASGFRLMHDITYRNAFLPVLKGSVIPAEDGAGSIVVVDARPPLAVLLFLLGWFGFLLVFTTVLFTVPVISTALFSLFFSVAVCLALLAGALVTWGFRAEFTKSVALLTKILQSPREGTAP